MGESRVDLVWEVRTAREVTRLSLLGGPPELGSWNLVHTIQLDRVDTTGEY